MTPGATRDDEVTDDVEASALAIIACWEAVLAAREARVNERNTAADGRELSGLSGSSGYTRFVEEESHNRLGVSLCQRAICTLCPHF